MLCAPSLGGESFGMVLTEAFAAGTPVVASDIAGYRDVVTDGDDGLLFPRGDATALAETLHDLAPTRAVRPVWRRRRGDAERYAWPGWPPRCPAYEDARRCRGRRRAARASPARAGGRLPRAPARACPRSSRARRAAAAALSPAGLAVAGARRHRGGSLLALQRIGMTPIVDALLAPSPTWVLLALALMCVSMVSARFAWHAILKAALPDARPRFADAMQGTSIGVLMSATLPARLGEPSRAYRRAPARPPRERLPVVLGTLVSQTLLNVLALLILGAVMFTTIGLFAGRQQALVWYALGAVRRPLPRARRARAAAGRRARSARVQAAPPRRSRARARAPGLRVFRKPALGAPRCSCQLAAWALQWLSCYVLLVALGLDRGDLGAAAASCSRST